MDGNEVVLRRSAPRRLTAVRGARRRGRVLVLGAGFIGAHATRHLVEDGYRVDVVTRSEPRADVAHLLSGARVAIGDLSSMQALASLVAEVDHIVYAVGSSSPVESDLDPAGDVALVIPPVVRLLELLRLRPEVGLTYLSSGGAVYGNVGVELADESTLPDPISSYGILKLTAENFLRTYSRLYGVPVQILRVSNAYGPGQPWVKGQGILPRLINCALTGSRFSIYGDGSNVRDYVYIEDVAAAITSMVSSRHPLALFNVGSGVGHSVIDLVQMVEMVSGRSIDIEYFPQRPFDVGTIVLDISRLRSHMEIEPLSLDEGVRRTWEAACLAVPTGGVPGDLIRVPQAQ